MMDFHKGRWRLALGRLVNLRYINRWCGPFRLAFRIVAGRTRNVLHSAYTYWRV